MRKGKNLKSDSKVLPSGIRRIELPFIDIRRIADWEGGVGGGPELLLGIAPVSLRRPIDSLVQTPA